MLRQEGAVPRQGTQAGARPAFLFRISAPVLFGLAVSGLENFLRRFGARLSAPGQT